MTRALQWLLSRLPLHARQRAARLLLEASGWVGGARVWLDAASATVDAPVACPGCGYLCPSLDVDEEEGCPACQLVAGVRMEVAVPVALADDERVNVAAYHRKGPPVRPS